MTDVSEGDRIRLISMKNEIDPVPPDTQGTIVGFGGSDPVGVQIFVDWDNGRRLFLLPEIDEWEVISG